MPRPFDPDELLSAPLMANLATMSEDGPRNVPMWFIWEDDAIWCLGSTKNRSVQRIEDDLRCAIEIIRFDNEAGILLHLGLRGSATIEPMDAKRFRRLLSKYLGPNQNLWNDWFIENIAAIEDPSGQMIRLAPRTTFTNNVSYFRTGPELAWP